MSTASTNRRSAAALANQSPTRPTPRATRYECQHCHTQTGLVLRTVGEAKCSVCDSFDLMPVEEQPFDQGDRIGYGAGARDPSQECSGVRQS
jgi:hypothetical protein